MVAYDRLHPLGLERRHAEKLLAAALCAHRLHEKCLYLPRDGRLPPAACHLLQMRALVTT